MSHSIAKKKLGEIEGKRKQVKFEMVKRKQKQKMRAKKRNEQKQKKNPNRNNIKWCNNNAKQWKDKKKMGNERQRFSCMP